MSVCNWIIGKMGDFSFNFSCRFTQWWMWNKFQINLTNGANKLSQLAKFLDITFITIVPLVFYSFEIKSTLKQVSSTLMLYCLNHEKLS